MRYQDIHQGTAVIPDNNLTLAKIYMKKYKEEVLDNPVPERLHYPQ